MHVRLGVSEIRHSRVGPLMVFFLGASFLYIAIKKLQNVKEQCCQEAFAIVVANLNLRSNKNKTVQHYPKIYQVIIWHDLVNNSISRYPKYPRQRFPASEIVVKLKALPGIKGIVNCEKTGAEKMFPNLFSEFPNFPILHFVKHLVSEAKGQKTCAEISATISTTDA